MRHPLMMEWERRLKKLFDNVDDYLEEKYGSTYKLHPNRPERGLTSNKEQDGLFNVGATFSAGYGSKYGRGYVVEVDMVTLDHIPDTIESRIQEDAATRIRALLPQFFPERELDLHKDGRAFKIHGDFTLGPSA